MTRFPKVEHRFESLPITTRRRHHGGLTNRILYSWAARRRLHAIFRKLRWVQVIKSSILIRPIATLMLHEHSFGPRPVACECRCPPYARGSNLQIHLVLLNVAYEPHQDSEASTLTKTEAIALHHRRTGLPLESRVSVRHLPTV